MEFHWCNCFAIVLNTNEYQRKYQCKNNYKSYPKQSSGYDMIVIRMLEI